MKLEYDKDVDAAYIYLKYPIRSGSAVKTVRLNETVILDFNLEGKLNGVEILNASKVLDRKALVKADIV